MHQAPIFRPFDVRLAVSDVLRCARLRPRRVLCRNSSSLENDTGPLSPAEVKASRARYVPSCEVGIIRRIDGIIIVIFIVVYYAKMQSNIKHIKRVVQTFTLAHAKE